MLRIALNYTGYLRTWEYCKPNHYENIITPDCELFFYTYDFKDPLYKDAENKYHFTRIPQPFYKDPFGEHRYNTRKAPENTAHQTLNQWTNNFVGFCLIPDNFDVVVRIRTDIKFNGKLNFNDYDYSGNKIYIPQGMDFGGVCDLFAWGSYDVMKKYYSVLVNCGELWRDGVLFHSETMQLNNLTSQGIEIVRPGFPQIDIIR